MHTSPLYLLHIFRTDSWPLPVLNDFDVMAVTFDGSYIATRYASYLEILILINL